MAYRKNNVMQVSMDDTFDHLSPRTQRIVMNSWAKPFADYVFPVINEDCFKVLYSDNPASRPSTPVNYNPSKDCFFYLGTVVHSVDSFL